MVSRAQPGARQRKLNGYRRSPVRAVRCHGGCADSHAAGACQGRRHATLGRVPRFPATIRLLVFARLCDAATAPPGEVSQTAGSPYTASRRESSSSTPPTTGRGGRSTTPSTFPPTNSNRRAWLTARETGRLPATSFSTASISTLGRRSEEVQARPCTPAISTTRGTPCARPTTLERRGNARGSRPDRLQSKRLHHRDHRWNGEVSRRPRRGGRRQGQKLPSPRFHLLNDSAKAKALPPPPGRASPGDVGVAPRERRHPRKS